MAKIDLNLTPPERATDADSMRMSRHLIENFSKIKQYIDQEDFPAENLNIVAGTLVSGTIDDVAEFGGTDLDIRGPVGGAFQFDIRADFNVTAGMYENLYMEIFAYTNTGYSAPATLQLWDNVRAAWEVVANFTTSGTYKEWRVAEIPRVPERFITAAGLITARLVQVGFGTSAYHFFIEFWNVRKRAGGL